MEETLRSQGVAAQALADYIKLMRLSLQAQSELHVYLLGGGGTTSLKVGFLRDIWPLGVKLPSTQEYNEEMQRSNWHHYIVSIPSSESFVGSKSLPNKHFCSLKLSLTKQGRDQALLCSYEASKLA